MKNPVILVIFIVGLAALVAFALSRVLLTSNKKKRSNVRQELLWAKRYKVYESFIITARGVSKVKNMYMSMKVYSNMTLYGESAKTYTLLLVTQLFTIIGGTVVLWDPLMVMILFAIVVMASDFVMKRIMLQMQLKMNKELKIALSQIVTNFYATGDIPDALAEQANTPLISRSIEQIYNILTHEDGVNLLEEFNDSAPLTQLRTLANVCYVINEKGTGHHDKRVIFPEAIQALSQEVGYEIKRLHTVFTRILPITYWALPVVFIIGPFETYTKNSVQGTVNILDGWMGYVLKALVILVSVVSYYRIVGLTEDIRSVDGGMNEILSRLLKIKPFKEFIDVIKPRGSLAVARAMEKLKSSMSSHTIETITAQRVLYSSISFILILIFMILGMGLGREAVYNNYTTFSINATGVITPVEKENRIKLDSKFMDKQEKPSEEKIKAEVAKIWPRKDIYKANVDNVERLVMKHKTYNSTYYKWYYTFVPIIVAIAFWFYPSLRLSQRKKLVEMSANDDLLQLQTLISILMFTPIDVMEMVREMSKASSAHKNLLIECYYSMVEDPDFYLEMLKQKVSLDESKRVVDKLKVSLDRISLEEAFSDLKSERQYNLMMRNLIVDASMEAKVRTAASMQIMPVMSLIMLLYMVPLLILSLRLFDTISQFL